MMIEAKPGVLRAELIGYQSILAKGIFLIKEVHEEVAYKGSWWNPFTSSRDKELFDKTTSISLITQAMTQKLAAMVQLCDEAYESGATLYIDVEDRMYLNSLKTLAGVVRG